MIYYLYKKTHNKTGLQYLGKTEQDPFKYKGSGNYWKRHIQQHGYDVTTEIIGIYSTNVELKDAGLHYSELWNVVESKEWANLRPEEGAGGTWPHSPETCQKISDAKKKYWANVSINLMQEHTEKFIEIMKNKPNGMKGKHHSKESKEKMSKSRKDLFLEGKLISWNKGKKGLFLSPRKGKITWYKKCCLFCKETFKVKTKQNRDKQMFCSYSCSRRFRKKG